MTWPTQSPKIDGCAMFPFNDRVSAVLRCEEDGKDTSARANAGCRSCCRAAVGCLLTPRRLHVELYAHYTALTRSRVLLDRTRKNSHILTRSQSWPPYQQLPAASATLSPPRTLPTTPMPPQWRTACRLSISASTTCASAWQPSPRDLTTSLSAAVSVFSKSEMPSA